MLKENLYRFRCERKMSQQQLAKMSEVSQSALSAWETGDQIPTAHNLKALAKGLSIPVDFLLDFNEGVARANLGSLSTEEKNFLDDFHKLDAVGKVNVLHLLSTLYENGV